jgi:hypothetical protein
VSAASWLLADFGVPDLAQDGINARVGVAVDHHRLRRAVRQSDGALDLRIATHTFLVRRDESQRFLGAVELAPGSCLDFSDGRLKAADADNAGGVLDLVDAPDGARVRDLKRQGVPLRA